MRFLRIAAFALSLAGTALADAPISFETLAGAWSGAGTFQGMASKVSATFTPLFDGKYWRLEIRTDYTTQDGKAAAFTGEGTYAAKATPMWGSWIDDTGDATALQPTIEGHAIVVRWGRPGEAPSGRSVTTLNADGTLTIEDFVETGAEPRSFAKSSLQRAP